VEQVLFAQQGWVEPPQALHVPVVEPPVVWQTFPGEQVGEPPEIVLLQQG
jgi:hypothetical protein